MASPQVQLQSKLAEEVRAAAGRGWRLFPVEVSGKLPLVKGWPEAATTDLVQLEAWAHLYRACNWGLATGSASGLAVIDVDGVEGRASLAVLERQGFTLPVTLTVTTGRADGGEHRYYRPPSGVDIHNDQSGKIGPHIDVRGTGGFVVIPPSIHESGKQYRFIDPDSPIADLPRWVAERLALRPPIPTAREQANPRAVGKGSRTNTLVSLAGTMHRRGMSLESIQAALLAENVATCNPPLSEAKVRSIAADIVKRYPAGEPTAPVAAASPPMTAEDAARITAGLLTQCRAWIMRYIVLSDEQATIMAAWILHTYAFDAAETTPYIHITAPEKESGKSRLMEALVAIAAAPVCSEGMTAAALVRTIAAKKPTIFLDEMDAQLGGDKERVQDIRGILNAGFRKGGVFYKCAANTFELQEFNVYCPKCFAGIGQLPGTVASRSIVIELRRKLARETVEPFREKAVKAAAAPIKAELEAWAGRRAVDLLQTVQPAPIASLSDRQNDIAEPLLAIAQIAGDGWLQRLTGALQMVFKATYAEDASIGVTLLRDIRSVFDKRREDQLRDADEIPSKDLAAQLCEIEGRLWAEWHKGKGLSPNVLAQQLKKFSIHPQGIRVGDKTPKGYRRAAFEDDWSRYCPLPPTQSATPPQPASPLTEAAFSNRNTPPAVALAKSASNPHEQRVVPDVPFEKPKYMQESILEVTAPDQPRDENHEPGVWV